MQPAPGDGNALNTAEGAASAPAAKARRRRLFMLLFLVAVLLGAISALFVPPVVAYLRLRTVSEPAAVSAGIEALRQKGPAGSELARRLLAARFRRRRHDTAELIREHQVLFHGLSGPNMVAYFGTPDGTDRKALIYVLAVESGAADIMIVRILAGRVDGVYLDRRAAPTRTGRDTVQALQPETAEPPVQPRPPTSEE